MDRPHNSIMVIFGASGDLTKKKLIPSLFELYKQELLCDDFAILGVSRTQFTDDQFRQNMFDAVLKYSESKDINKDILKNFILNAYYLPINTEDVNDYKYLKEKLDGLNTLKVTHGNYIYYLSTPPKLYETIVTNLGTYNLQNTPDEHGSKKIIIEKPFGYDFDSARKLNAHLPEIFKENQIYRIDHYLGKETVQNILVLRFANGMFEPIWNRNHIDHVQITVDEKLGVGHRGSFYDSTGPWRDMVPNHLFQLLSLVAMEPPTRFDAHSVRSEKADVLAAIQTQSEADALKNSVRGQYQGGKIGDTEIEDYCKTEDVKPGSTTETYAAVKLTIDNWRWAGVPFYLRTGKALGIKRTEVAIKFKQAPFAMFSCTPVDRLSQNYLVISIEPTQGIMLQFNTKVPGPTISIDGVEMK